MDMNSLLAESLEPDVIDGLLDALDEFFCGELRTNQSRVLTIDDVQQFIFKHLREDKTLKPLSCRLPLLIAQTGQFAENGERFLGDVPGWFAFRWAAALRESLAITPDPSASLAAALKPWIVPPYGCGPRFVSCVQRGTSLLEDGALYASVTVGLLWRRHLVVNASELERWFVLLGVIATHGPQSDGAVVVNQDTVAGFWGWRWKEWLATLQNFVDHSVLNKPCRADLTLYRKM